LGLVAPVVLPTGGGTALRGEKGVGMQPRLAADYAFESGTRLLANVGVNLRSRQELLNLSVGNELSYGLGAAIPFQVQGHPLMGLASLAGAFGLGATGGTSEEEMPLELQAGLQYPFSKNVTATLGGGRGLTLGYGMPVFRVFTGFTWTPDDVTQRPKDSDNDGVPDSVDQCPNEPEDKDGFQDEDGCPDPDNDGDGVPDAIDKCPNEPETKNGYQDDDGCPDELPQKLKQFTGVIQGINFRTGDAALQTNSNATLDRAVAVLKEFGDLKLEIQGHTDDQPLKPGSKYADNQALSQGRADAVKAYLVSKGIAESRLIAKGYGDTVPVESPKDLQGDKLATARAKNRRVEFKLVSSLTQ
ncbi:MAG TPA: OmpA family protein, partial [Kofleriaceae bacterium]